ncbi:tRNA (adenosine(37)-N6)-threonylcarbamoyltransferase complex ATPase subunit type 1 TsaE [Patescibacteria group bacterium]
MKTDYLFDSEEALAKFTKEFSKTIKSGSVIALVGDLGAGKTTFTKYLAKELGVEQEITSPTFTLAREYSGKVGSEPITFYHLDAYRLKNSEEAKALGLEDWLADKKGVLVIEWAEKIKDLLSPETIWLRFEHTKNPQERKLIIA